MAAAPTHDAHATDPPLLRKHSAIEEFQTGRFTYPSIRVFFKRHEQGDQLPVDPAPLPLLVFIHGLGGSVAQFHPLLARLSNCASCLAVDLPGCGRSGFAPQDWAAYSPAALVDLLDAAVARYRLRDQAIVLIGHSMGCSLAALLAARHAVGTQAAVDSPVAGLVAICPPAELDDEAKIATFKTLLWIPSPLFNLWRMWDGRGGANSPSVLRFVGPDADEETRHMQARFNHQSKTPVWRRVAWGLLPTYDGGKRVGGLAGREVWASLKIPVCLIAGESDHVTPPSETRKILSYLGSPAAGSPSAGAPSDTPTPPASANAGPGTAAAVSPLVSEYPPPGIPPAATTGTSQAATVPPSRRARKDIGDITPADFAPESQLQCRQGSDDETPTTPGDASGKLDIPAQHRHPPEFAESHVIPSPANHTLLYMPSTVGVLSGLVANFLAEHVTGRLDRGWQLRFLSREGKWDVKNLEKWTKVEPISRPIAGIFRAMKTLRQVDKVHSPEQFVQKWAATVKDVIDISHDNPVYDPRDLEAGGIHYHKFPTVSKVPPTAAEVDAFVALVDKIRAQRQRPDSQGPPDEPYFIGVHCHYGFNRTGYFIVCYLVDRCGFTVSDAVKAFAEARPVGIRHSHFLDALSLKYANVADDLNTSSSG